MPLLGSSILPWVLFIMYVDQDADIAAGPGGIVLASFHVCFLATECGTLLAKWQKVTKQVTSQTEECDETVT